MISNRNCNTVFTFSLIHTHAPLGGFVFFGGLYGLYATVG